MKHRWAEAVRDDPWTTRRVCLFCGLVKVTRHEPDKDPQHWTEWEPPIERPPPEPVRPLLAPGEREEDVWL